MPKSDASVILPEEDSPALTLTLQRTAEDDLMGGIFLVVIRNIATTENGTSAEFSHSEGRLRIKRHHSEEIAIAMAAKVSL